MSLVFDRVRQNIDELSIPPFQVGPSSAFFLEKGRNFGTIYGKKWIRSISELTDKQLTRLGKTASDFEVNSDGYVITKAC